ncbi:MAG: hypothetical protein ABFD96_13005 [Armatimonadia bacterium]
MSAEQAVTPDLPGQWVPVASYRGLFQELEADLAVCTLKGAGLLAMRVPLEPQTALLNAPVPGVLPIVVWTPEEGAAEVLGAQERQEVPEPVRGAARWFGLLMVSMPVGGGIVYLMGASEHSARLTGAIGIGISIGLLWRGVELAQWLHRTRVCFPRRQVLAVAALVWIAMSLILGPLPWLQEKHQVVINLLVLAMAVMVARIVLLQSRGGFGSRRPRIIN